MEEVEGDVTAQFQQRREQSDRKSVRSTELQSPHRQMDPAAPQDTPPRSCRTLILLSCQGAVYRRDHLLVQETVSEREKIVIIPMSFLTAVERK